MNRRGVALPLTMLALLLLGALASLVLLSARMRWLSGMRGLEALQARLHAEGEADRVVARWDPIRADSMAVGSVEAIPPAVAVPGLIATDSLLRLGAGLYLVRTVGARIDADGAMRARDGVARLVRLLSAVVPDSAASFAAGPSMVVDAALVDGGDVVPAGWSGLCAAPSSLGEGIIHAPAAPPSAGCTAGPCIAGSPATAPDTTLSAARLGQLGPLSLTDVVQGADHAVAGTALTVAPALSGAGCDRTDSLNWGDPSAPSAACGGYFPVIVAAPGTRLAGGHAQGILVGLGGLEFSNDFEFDGVVLARGPLVLRDQSRVLGVVLAADSLRVEGTAQLLRSTCAVRRSVAGGARPFRAVERGWFRWD